jgi:hypothetical protein
MLADHLAYKAEPDEIYVYSLDGQEYVAVFGPYQGLPRIPTGPPVYIFDRNDRLTDWSPDIGDDERFGSRRLNAAYNGCRITREELVKWPGATR